MIAAILIFFVVKIHFKEDIADFLPDNADNKQINAIYEHIGNSNRIIISFENKNQNADNDNIITAIDYFSEILKEDDIAKIIPQIISQADENQFFEITDFIRKNIPYFLQKSDYQRIDSLISAKNIEKQIVADKQQLMFPTGDFLLENIQNDPLQLFSPVMLKLADFQAGESQNIIDGHIFSPSGKKGLVFVTSPFGDSETANNKRLLNLIEKSVQQTESEFNSLKISVFGAPAIAITNASQIKKDTILAVALAVALILILLIYFFSNAQNLLLIFVSVLFGGLFAIGLLAIFRDTISTIVVSISSIFIGIAVNYPLHFIDHLRHEPNKILALRQIIPPLLIGNITTVSAFLSLIFINSQAMRDLGLFSSLLLVGTMIFVLIFLPQIIKNKQVKHSQSQKFGKISDLRPEKSKILIISILILTIVFWFFSTKTGFEPDMNKINYMTAIQRENMNEMLQSIEHKDADLIYFISEGKTPDDALTAYESNISSIENLKKSGLAESISGIGNFLPSENEQKNRIEMWNNFWQNRKDSVVKNINYYAKIQGFKQNSFINFENILNKKFEIQNEDYFTPLNVLTENYFFKNKDKNLIINLIYAKKENISKVENFLKNETANGFIFDQRNIGQRLVDALSSDFNRVLLICGLIVFVFLTFSFGRIEISIMAFIPLAISWLWILGIMYILGIEFNIVNIILATFIFGQGDDYTIFVADGLIYEYAYHKKMLAAHKQSIILSALLMFIGIGTLIFAHHPALRSLAEVTIVGMIVVVVMAFIVPPIIFRFLTQKKGKIRLVPWTLKRFWASFIAFSAFLVGSFIITLYGILLFKINKKQNIESKKLKYHTFLQKISGFVIKRIPFVKFRFENANNETFENPAVIISNHQSHLDLMCLIMLCPKIIVLTNDWVWNNIFYGKLIKFADFYPVSNGIEQSIDLLRERVEHGYSVVVFPEGTRSENCDIQRFHRGAFFLAEKLNLDIVPVVLHGVGEILPKTDFLLRQGQITSQILPRITPADVRFTPDYATRSKQIRIFYKEKFAELCAKTENAEYFRSFVLHQFIYKGMEIYKKAKKELQSISDLKLTNYNLKDDEIGVAAFVTALVHKDLEITAATKNPEIAALLQNCAGRPKNLKIVTLN
ncbi:MAG: 1-acyl-sn-glycerol-3-phosphate acyltransferase [Paludibacter sp.]|nr:1-acyl-sn-glycerol-3-phosphate acyltransferase [Paludibacter sp.]